MKKKNSKKIHEGKSHEEIYNDPALNWHEKLNILTGRAIGRLDDNKLRKLIDEVLRQMNLEARPNVDIYHDPNMSLEEKLNILMSRSIGRLDDVELTRMIDRLVEELTSEAMEDSKLADIRARWDEMRKLSRDKPLPPPFDM